MQTSITQTLALVVFGNKFLAGRSVEGFWPNATVFEFCRDVKFLDRQGQALAPNPQVWFERLKPKKARALKWLGKAENADTVGLQLRYGSTGKDDRSTVGFVGGGGHWLIEQVTRSGKCRLWEGHWELGDRNAPDQKIWDVSYRCTGDGKPSPVQPTTLIPSIRDQLDKVLREIAVFAQEAGANQFASSFERAYLALSSNDPLREPYHIEFRDGDLTLPAMQLLGAIFHGWVFGGMGSWNDNPVGDNARNAALSNRLFDTLVRAIVAVANSTIVAK